MGVAKFSINEGGNLGFQIRGGIYIYIYIRYVWHKKMEYNFRHREETSFPLNAPVKTS